MTETPIEQTIREQGVNWTIPMLRKLFDAGLYQGLRSATEAQDNAEFQRALTEAIK